MDEDNKSRISGKDARYVALAEAKYGPVRIDASDGSVEVSRPVIAAESVPVALNSSPGSQERRRAPPRVREPSPHNNQCLAPTPDLTAYRARLREAFGNTMSDEFVDVMLGKVIEALKPNPFHQLDEPTMNAALAIIDSAQCRSELEAFIAVQIVATGFAGLRFLRQSQHQLTAEYIDTYGPYAHKLNGIPLFVEEMTKAVLEAESEGDARQTAAIPSPVLAVPASLHASLMARLDRLGPAREVAQIGAAMGREFSHALLGAVAGKPETELAAALDRLVAAGLVFRQGVPPQANYLFKHALVQERLTAHCSANRDARFTLASLIRWKTNSPR